MAELFRRAQSRQCSRRTRYQSWHGAHRSSVQRLRLSPGSCVPGRPSPYRPALLHQFPGDEVRAPRRMKKFLFDLFPLILFFIAFRFADIYTATAVAIAAGVLQFLWLKLRGKTIETMHWINLGVIVVFGGATLFFQNDAFIKWKPTVLYWIFAVALIGSRLFFK